jgi:DNA polymerase-3 subunit delta
MDIDRDALQLLSDRVEGNLLAAVQEVEKLKLLAADGKITALTVTDSVCDNARYNIFAMADNILGGDITAGLRMLHGLRGEGTEPPVVLWSISRELRTLHAARLACDAGQNVQKALQDRGVWKNRMPMMSAALQRHTAASLAALLEQAAITDGSIKGFAGGKPWDNMENLFLGLAGSANTLPAALALA